jgi:hypothetical protein
MDADYFNAAIPEPTIIFGVQLLPLSLGRYRLLHRFGCEFVSEKAETCGIESLLLGILICGMPCADFLAMLDDPNGFTVETAKLGERMRAEIDADRYFSVFSKFGLFKAYISDGSRVPAHFVEMENPNANSSHWSQSLELILRHELNYTQSEIDEGPLSKCLADYFSWAEGQGAVRLIHGDEPTIDEQAERAFENMMKGASWPA